MSTEPAYFHTSPLTVEYAYSLVRLMEDDNANDLGWSFGGTETPQETLDAMISQHGLKTGFFWALFQGDARETKPIGFIGFYERGDEPSDGFSAKVYIHSSKRGQGIYGTVKTALIEFLARRGVTLYSRISTKNHRSLAAHYKLFGYDAETHLTDDGYRIFEATKKAKERIYYNLESPYDARLEELIFRLSCDATPFLENWIHRNSIEDPRLTVKEVTVACALPENPA